MSHLSYEQRYTIEVLLQAGELKSVIADKLNIHKSVIYRELKRNCDERNSVYKAKLAQSKYEKRIQSKPRNIKFDSELQGTVIQMIEQQYSPEQIAGVLKKQGGKTISHEIIYQFVWKNKKSKGTLFLHLRRKGRRNRKRGSSKDTRGQIVGRVGIEKRPKEAEERNVFGHLEVDTIIGQSHKGAIVTLNDRASGMLWMRKVQTRDAELVRLKLCEMLEEIKPFIRSITADNGKEFSEHQIIADEYCDFFFANPYSPWERGSNENLNGLIRQYIPKSSDFLTLSEERIKEIEIKLNTRPRKRFDFESPIFVMDQLLFNPKVALVA